MKNFPIDQLPPRQLLQLLELKIPSILSSDRFYQKFAGRLQRERQSKDLLVAAAQDALNAPRRPYKANHDYLSRMIASVALTGCLARSLQPVRGMGIESVLKACEQLLWDCPEMLSIITSLQQTNRVTFQPEARTNPLDN